MSATAAAASPPPAAPLALALLLAAVLAGGGAVSAGCAAATAAFEAADKRDDAEFQRSLDASSAQSQADGEAGLRSHASAELDRGWRSLLDEIKDQRAKSLGEQAALRRGAQAADARRSRAERWRDGLTALASALVAATAVVGSAGRPRLVRWGAAALGVAAVTWGGWATVADLLGAGP